MIRVEFQYRLNNVRTYTKTKRDRETCTKTKRDRQADIYMTAKLLRSYKDSLGAYYNLKPNNNYILN